MRQALIDSSHGSWIILIIHPLSPLFYSVLFLAGAARQQNDTLSQRVRRTFANKPCQTAEKAYIKLASRASVRRKIK